VLNGLQQEAVYARVGEELADVIPVGGVPDAK